MIKNLKKIRTKRNLKQKELAQLCEISHIMIAFIETNKRTCSVELLIKLAKVLKCSTDYLLGLKETEN